MKWRFAFILPVLGLGMLQGFAQAASIPERAHGVVVLSLSGSIDPISARYVQRGLARAVADGAQLVVVDVDTPGGLSTSMDEMVQAILASPIPVAVYVSPAGARAASAGVYITMAAHIAAMAPGTHIGAAHPVAAGGADIQGTEGQKVENDALAQIRSLAELRGRNESWAQDAVKNSVSLTETEALKQRVVDVVAPDLSGLLAEIDGRHVKTADGEVTLRTVGAAVQRSDMGLIERLLDVLVNPDLSYILMVIGILGIIFELSSPGIGAPGIAGAIAIVLSMVGFGSLPTNLGGFVFIALGVVLFIVDVKVPSHGVWTAGGIASFLLGSLLLFPPWHAPALPAMPHVGISPLTMGVMTGLVTLFFMFVVSRGIAAQHREVAVGAETLIGVCGTAVTDISPEGQVRAGGEVWSARSPEGGVRSGDAVEIVDREGLHLIVRKREET